MDQVKQQVWIAEALIDQYGDIIRRYQEAWSAQDEAECHVLIGELERIYPGIWEQLDSAAKLTAGAGRDTDTYARIRARPDLVTTNALASVTSRVVGTTHLATKTVVTSELLMQHNQDGVDIAREAVRALQATWPELDWTPPAPTGDIDVRGGFFSRLLRRLLR